MNNGVAFGIGAGVGLLVGGGVAFLVCNTVLKNHYEDILLLEVDSVKVEYRQMVKELKDKAEKDVQESERKIKSTVNLNKPTLEKNAYQTLAARYSTAPVKKDENKIRIESITPDQYGMLDDDGYTSDELYFYTDGILANADGDIIDDANDYAGDFESGFGKNGAEDDESYMRNYTDKIDIVVYKSAKAYSDEWGSIPNKEE